MSLTQPLIAELQHEATNTQKLLERIPNDKMDWKPHPKSRSVHQLAIHLVKVVRWAQVIVDTDEVDITAQAPPAVPAPHAEDLVRLFLDAAQQSVNALERITEEQLNDSWMMRRGEQVIIEMPKAAAIRNICLNHLYHHRAQLGLYLRLLDVPIPGMYGPSADEMEHFKE